MVVASAPGKIHIIGEHAVVYGEPAILSAVGLRTFVAAEKSDDVRYVDARWGHDNTWNLDDVLETTRYVRSLWEKGSEEDDFSEMLGNVKENRYENYKKTVVGVVLGALNISGGAYIRIHSDVPSGAGMGSSASLEAALVKSVAEEYGIPIGVKRVNEITFEMEKIIHGNPSGGDNSACCYGGMMLFEKQKPFSKITQFTAPRGMDDFVLVNTGTPEKTTGELVQYVRNLDETYRTRRVNEIGRMSHEMFDALKAGDLTKVAPIISRAQANLYELGVSTPGIDRVVHEVEAIGGAAKLCGAGGGGMMLCYHSDREELKNLLRDLGYNPIETSLSAPGVRVD